MLKIWYNFFSHSKASVVPKKLEICRILLNYFFSCWEANITLIYSCFAFFFARILLNCFTVYSFYLQWRKLNLQFYFDTMAFQRNGCPRGAMGWQGAVQNQSYIVKKIVRLEVPTDAYPNVCSFLLLTKCWLVGYYYQSICFFNLLINTWDICSLTSLAVCLGRGDTH